MSKVTIALDAMGGDRGYSVVVPAAVHALRKYPALHLILVGDKTVLENALQHIRGYKLCADRLTIHHASEIVEMGERPSLALRYKKDSSMRVAINLVKAGEAQACVSAGNTGALMATARFVLKTLSGINRPAIIDLIPAENEVGHVRVLDLGANIDSSPEELLQFAVMGSVLAKAVDGIENPKVALLNIGEEEIKGNDVVKEAANLLNANKGINYIGYVEGSDIFHGPADVIVCDGFVGNVALKSIEGLAKFMGKIIKGAFRRNIFTKLAGLSAIFVLRHLAKRLDPDLYNGAIFVGLKGIVVKSHGNTSVRGFETAIECAMAEAEHHVPDLIQNEVSNLLK